MVITPGTLLSHYRLVEKLGEGGMGVVWKAVDTTLDRQVAIKILPESLATDPDRLARFEREARLLASLNHPNIASIYSVHEFAGARFLAMELVEGEDLAQRLRRHPMPVDEALPIAVAIARALEAAHESGVVHRDLKPANILVTPAGHAKVLDFGLAKALFDDHAAAPGNRSLSPTITSAGTAAGVILGTAAYMSPEQAHGRAVDRRADIWSFGCVLFEMLSGTVAFQGESVSDTLALVLRGEPSWNRLPSGTPPAIRRLIRRCLERDPLYRLQAIGEARVILERLPAEPDVPGAMRHPPEPGRSGRRGRVAILAALIGTALASSLLTRSLTPPTARPLRRFVIPVERLGIDVGVSPLISPDGKRAAFTSGDSLWVRDFDALEPRELVGSGSPRYVFWSPDSRQIAYIAAGKLWRVAATGGSPAAITTANIPLGGSTPGGVWTEDERILFAQSASGSGLLTVPAQGGDFGDFIRHDPRVELDFHKPSLLPEGRGLLMIVDRKGTGPDTIELVTLAGERKQLLQLERERLDSPVYSPSGHILYQRDTTTPGIWAVPFSLDSLEVTGTPFLVVADAIWPSVSADGTLLYVQAQLSLQVQLVAVDESGTILERHGDPSPSQRFPAISPDGTRVAFVANDDSRQADIYLQDLTRGNRSRLTFTDDEEEGPAWAGNDWIVFQKNARGSTTVGSTIHARRADGTGDELLLTEGFNPSVSPDLRFLIFSRFGEASAGADPGADVWWLPLTLAGDSMTLHAGEASLFVDMARWQETPLFAPDGRHVVYRSASAGVRDLFVRSFPAGDGPWQVSRGGGGHPRWAPDGDRLYYLSGEDLMEIGVEWAPRIAFGTPRVLFSTGDAGINHRRLFDIAPDGRRFMMMQNVGDSTSRRDALTIVENWHAEFAPGDWNVEAGHR